MNGSHAQANCNGGEEILLVKVDVMVCFENFTRQFSGTWILVAVSKLTISDVAFLHIIVDVCMLGEYTRCSVSVNWYTIS